MEAAELFEEVATEAACPFCGEDALETLDLLHGGNLVDWAPCCLAMSEYVNANGWEDVFGDVRQLLEERVGVEAPREVYTDEVEWVARWSLHVVNPGEKRVKGWQAKVFAVIDEHHSHHDAPAGWKFGVACYNGPTLVAVAVVGRPVARMIATKQPDTLEVTRVCCFGDPRLRRNAATKLYAECAKEARRRGCTKLITYTLESEAATSVKAAGWTRVAESKGGSWDRPSRPREDKGPTDRKVRWEKEL